MLNYVPAYILSKLRQQKPRGSFNSFILDCRIAELRPMLAGFEKQGQAGADKLSDFLNIICVQLFEIVENRGGFVARMEGDSFLAVFPGVDAPQILAAAKELEGINRETGKNKPSPHPKLRMAMGYGRVNWRVMINPLQYECVFYGPELETLEVIPAKTGSLRITDKARAKLGALGLLNEKGRPKSSRAPKPIPFKLSLDSELRELQTKFTHPRLHNLEPKTSFQSAACIMVSLAWEGLAQVEQMVQNMEVISIAFKAFMLGARKKSSEYNIFAYFGVPFKDSEMYHRACRVSLDILKKYPDLRMGIAADTVFSTCLQYPGGCQYLVFGEVGLRTREIWEHSKPGKVATDAAIWNKTNKDFSFRSWQTAGKTVKQASEQLFELTGMLSPSDISLRETFVGRKEELSFLEGLIDQTLASERNYVAHICGDPGIGKTRLMVEILKLSLARGFTVLTACCEMPISAPLDPVKQFFDRFFGMKPELAQDEALEIFRQNWKKWARGRKKFAELEPFIAFILDLRWEESPLEMIPPDLRLWRSLEGGAHFLALVSQDVPLLLAIDDLQWLDPRSRLFLTALGELEPVRIGILASSRYLDDGSVPTLEIPGFESLHLDLNPLALGESLELCTQLLGLETLPKDTASFFSTFSDGNPFNIEQVMSSLVEEGNVNARGEITVPANWQGVGIHKVLLRRINHLSAKTRESVMKASVLGMRFNIKVLSEMLNSSPAPHLDKGFQSGIWRDLNEVFYIFSHILIQEAVYSTIVADELRELHLSAAKAMEKVFAKDLHEHAAEIANHFEKAEQLDQAALYHFKAGELYWDQNFLDKSEYHFRHAADLSEAACGRESHQFCRHYFYLALLYHYQNRYEKADPVYHEAVGLAKNLYGQRSLELSPFLNNLGRFYKDIGRYKEAEKLLERSLAMERKLDPSSSNIADRMNNLAHLYSKQGNTNKAIEYLERCLLIMEYPTNRNHFFLGTVCDNLGRLYFSLGHMGRAKELITRGHEITKKRLGANHPHLAINMVSLGRIHLQQNEPEQAEVWFLKALENLKGPFGKYHSRTLGVVESLRQLYADLGETEKEAFYARWLEKGQEYDETGTPQHYKF